MTTPKRIKAKKEDDLGDKLEAHIEQSVASGTFMDKVWKPAFAMTYMAICLFDFIVCPIVYSILQFLSHNPQLGMWQAVTLQGGGLFHLSAGAILGITAFKKG